MRLEKLPLKLTTGNVYQSCGNISGKKNADCTAGKSYVHGLGVDSTTFLGESVSRNRKSTENNFIVKMEFRRTHPSQSYFQKSLQAIACKIFIFSCKAFRM